jgi:hypothetical protein
MFVFRNKDSVDVKMRPDSKNPEEIEFEEKLSPAGVSRSLIRCVPHPAVVSVFKIPKES